MINFNFKIFFSIILSSKFLNTEESLNSYLITKDQKYLTFNPSWTKFLTKPKLILDKLNYENVQKENTFSKSHITQAIVRSVK